MTVGALRRSLAPALSGLALMVLAQACSTTFVPSEFDFDRPALSTIEVNGSVAFTNGQDSTERETVSSYGGMTAEADYHTITEVMVRDASRVVRENQKSLGGTAAKTIALKVLSLRSRYIAFFWKSSIQFTAALGDGRVLSKEVTNAGPDTMRDLNGCIAQGVLQLLNDPVVRAYLAS